MKGYSRFLCGMALLLAISATAVKAAPTIEGTPVPLPPKPDFSSMQFLIGTWTCVDRSSRRPGPFTITEVYAMDPTGYFINRNDTTHKASWIPRDFHGLSRYTYDTAANRWVRISTSDVGGYAIATAPGSSGGHRVFTNVIQKQADNVASYAPEVYTKISNTKKTMTTTFTETNGRVVHVQETCTKS